MHGAVHRGPTGHVEPDHRHGLGNLDVLALARRDRLEQRVLVPGSAARALHALQEPGGEIVDALDTHTAMRQEPVIRAEQPLRWRIVHVDGELVRHRNPNRPEGIAGTRILPQRVVRRFLG